MKAVGTPDTVPSLAEVSQASTDVDEITRVLFETPEQQDLEESKKKFSSEGDKDSIFGSDVSVGSLGASSVAQSEVTKVVQDKQRSVSPIPRPAFNSPLKSEPVFAEEIQAEASCPGGLNLSPQQLAGIFTLFDGSQHWLAHQDSAVDGVNSPMSTTADPGNDDASTTVTSNLGCASAQSHKAESLQRECAALKEINRVDSANILKLKSALETLRSNSSKHLTETKSLRSELEQVKRERDLLKEREAQHLETINILKEEIDNLTRVSKSPAVSADELERMRLENELFASQVIENEVEMKAIQSALQLLESENGQMVNELKALQEKIGVEHPAKSRSEVPTSSQSELAKHVESLEERLADIERDREKTMHLAAEESRRREEEIQSIKSLVLANSPGREGDKKGAVSVDVVRNDEVEVTLDGPVESVDAKPNDDTPKNISKKERETSSIWNLCDCFPAQSSEQVV